MEKGSTSENCFPSCFYSRLSKPRQFQALGPCDRRRATPRAPFQLLGRSIAGKQLHGCHTKPSGAERGLVPRHTGTVLCPRRDQSEQAAAPRWPAICGSLPADPGYCKHHFVQIPSLNSSSLLLKRIIFAPTALFSNIPASCSFAMSHLRLLMTGL